MLGVLGVLGVLLGLLLLLAAACDSVGWDNAVTILCIPSHASHCTAHTRSYTPPAPSHAHHTRPCMTHPPSHAYGTPSSQSQGEKKEAKPEDDEVRAIVVTIQSEAIITPP